jgi:hypothetical protein
LFIFFSEKFERHRFDPILTGKYLTTFEVMDVREIVPGSNGNIESSKKFTAMEIDVVRANQFGSADATVFTVVSHLGRHLRCGDSVLGYDTRTW